MKSQKFKYITFFMLTFMLIFIFVFQNCEKNEDVLFLGAEGYNAIFKLSEKYGGDNVSKILWQIKSGNSCGMGTKAVKTGSSIEIPWNQDYDKGVHSWTGFGIAALIHLEQEECFIYRNFGFGDVFSSDSLDRLSCAIQYGSISFSLSDNPSIKKSYFPVGSSVNLEFKIHENIENIEEELSLEDKPFQWSIKKIGDDTELADQSHASPQLSHTFLEMGLYDISIKETSEDFRFSDNKELFIGLCEEEIEAVEVALDQESFGSATPKGILRTAAPIFNYVRPSDTDTNNKVTIVLNEKKHFLPSFIYKYKRNSSSQFIDIDIQNADKCFLDTEPINCEDCFTSYEVRENLSPLPSCSGNALDLSTLDKDTTQCTDDIFVVAASKTGREKMQEAFYKHCPANEDYCYFGYFGHRGYDQPKDHKCPSP